MNHRAQSIAITAGRFEDSIALLTIGELNLGSGGISNQLIENMPGDLFFLLQEKPLEVPDPCELLSPRRRSGSVYPGPRRYSRTARPKSFVVGLSPFPVDRYRVRKPPMGLKLSRANPGGSISR